MVCVHQHRRKASLKGAVFQAPCRVVGSVQGLREELAQVASEVEEIKKQQKEAMSMVETQLKTLCSQFDELSEVVGQQKQQQGEAAP